MRIKPNKKWIAVVPDAHGAKRLHCRSDIEVTDQSRFRSFHILQAGVNDLDDVGPIPKLHGGPASGDVQFRDGRFEKIEQF